MSRRIQKAIGVTISSLIFAGIIASNAVADIIQISAVTFAARAGSVTPGTANQGTMTNADGRYYAAVPFTTNGNRVCRFTLVHRDFDSDAGITARLMKKKVLVGSNAFEAPVVMATAATRAGFASQFVGKRHDTIIDEPVINLNAAFYYVELEFGNALLEALGVQIDVRPSCPN
jgi:hypothetical protein